MVLTRYICAKVYKPVFSIIYLSFSAVGVKVDIRNSLRIGGRGSNPEVKKTHIGPAFNNILQQHIIRNKKTYRDSFSISAYDTIGGYGVASNLSSCL